MQIQKLMCVQDSISNNSRRKHDTCFKRFIELYSIGIFFIVTMDIT